MEHILEKLKPRTNKEIFFAQKREAFVSMFGELEPEELSQMVENEWKQVSHQELDAL
jgi:hypothetical protein